MEVKQKSKVTNILKIIVFTLILLILTLGANTKTNAAELFWEDIPLSFHGIPRYNDIGPLVFCSKKGYGTEVYIDCSKKIAALLGSGTITPYYKGFGGRRSTETYTILGEDPITKAVYSWGGTYEITEKYGPIYNSDEFRDDVGEFLKEYRNRTSALGDLLITTGVYGLDWSTSKAYHESTGRKPGLNYETENLDGMFDYERVHDEAIGLPLYYGSMERNAEDHLYIRCNLINLNHLQIQKFRQHYT